MLPSRNELIAAVDAAFDHARQALGAPTDGALGEKLGISSKTISFLRNGRWTPVDAALIAVLIGAKRRAYRPSITQRSRSRRKSIT